MTCAEAREVMLTVDLTSLHRGGTSELRVHLSTCARCARLAAALDAETGLLGQRLKARARRRRALVLASLPIAAALVVMLVRSTGDRRPQPAVSLRGDVPSKVISVDVAAGQRATVIHTADPKVTVVWISSGDN